MEYYLITLIDGIHLYKVEEVNIIENIKEVYGVISKLQS
jgi:hypothetical protein